MLLFAIRNHGWIYSHGLARFGIDMLLIIQKVLWNSIKASETNQIFSIKRYKIGQKLIRSSEYGKQLIKEQSRKLIRN